MALLCHRLTPKGHCPSLDNYLAFSESDIGDISADVSLVRNSSRSLGEYLVRAKEEPVAKFLHQLWSDERGQDVAEYAVMLAVVLVIVVGTIRLIGGNANNVFSSVASSITQ
jgi:Flp pilus assembly pilin Flp